jgi:hypothetical protein
MLSFRHPRLGWWRANKDRQKRQIQKNISDLCGMTRISACFRILFTAMGMLIFFCAQSSTLIAPRGPPSSSVPQDKCLEYTKHVLTPEAIEKLDMEASTWRMGLLHSLHTYYNAEQDGLLKIWSDLADFTNAQHKTDYKPRPPNTGDIITDRDIMSSSTESYTSNRFDMFLPREVAQLPDLCIVPPDEWKTGIYRDGATWNLCGLDSLKTDSSCVIYSLGSNNQFQFEDKLLSSTMCEIHTFDCTSDPPRGRNEDSRLFFHKICIGTPPSSSQIMGPFKSFHQVISELGHTSVRVMKWDVEGFEWDIFEEFFSDTTILPNQILFELHYRSHMKAETDWMHREKHAGEIALLAIQLYDAGYRVMHSTANPSCSSCYEWNLMRVHCPAY